MDAAARLREGLAIPAHPLALDQDGRFDERSQRALTRYYLDAGAGGIAVGVHTTQFEIRAPEHGLLEPVLELAAVTAGDSGKRQDVILLAGVNGPTDQAVQEATTAACLGYDAVLLSPGGPRESEAALLDRAAAVGTVLPVVGFYLQEQVGGRFLSRDFWRRLCNLPTTVAIKVAPFDRYRTLDVVNGLAQSDRADQVALYTGNDDSIVADLLADLPAGRGRSTHFSGALLGQFAVWTRTSMQLFELVRRARAGGDAALRETLRLGPRLVDANGAVFDAAHRFAGCIRGVNEVLRRQGLVTSSRLLDHRVGLSPAHAAELDRVAQAYPELNDDVFVAANLDRWRA